MNKYLELFRLENGIIGIVGVAVTAFIAVGTDMVSYWQYILFGCVTVILFIAGGNGLNDYIDREIDKASHPERPLPSGRMEPETALRISVACLILSFASSFVQLFNGENYPCIIIVGIAIILMVLYETMLKQRGFVGNLTIAILTGMVFLLGGSIVAHMENCIEIAGMAALVTVGREITKDIEDMEGDEGRHTLPMTIGKRNAGIVAAAFYIAGPILSILPLIEGSMGPLYPLVFIADGMFIYTAFILFNDPHRSQKTAKYAMMVALVAFILGAVKI